ncbi:MFS family permease [Salirhabdus euzebyi]|uniref:MFS family permease n=1 Tax=Salirhabdus euzebyi TaxID=394506 RepID=A0A841PWV8_9BACI|nr:MFS transporter [Salirhabdus euzebyi]MBB6451846.1 MFS family permease [Salirhabdus euzebyi]
MQSLRSIEKPMIVLLIGVLLSHLGTYMVIPILPIMLNETIGLSFATVGLVLATYAIAFQFGSLFGGFLADRIGRRQIIGLGALVGAVGFFGLGMFSIYMPVLIATVIAGLGNGLNAPSTKAAIAALASKGNETTAFSLRGISANIGTAIAGLVVFFLVSGSPTAIFWIAGGIYVVIAIKSWLLLPKKCGDAPCPVIPAGAYKDVFKNKPFVVFGLLSIFIWALYAQLGIALPLVATEVLAEPSNVALIWTIKSVTVILLQTWITKKIISRMHPLLSLSIGLLLIGFGVGSLFWANSFFFLIISGTIFVFGEMLILPTMDSTISQLSQAGLIGLFFGLANILSGLGEAAGNFIGGRLLEIGTEINYLPWLVFAIAGIVLSAIVVGLIKWNPLQTSLEKAAEQEDKPQNAPHVNPGPTTNLTQPFHGWEEDVFFRKKTTT